MSCRKSATCALHLDFCDCRIRVSDSWRESSFGARYCDLYPNMPQSLTAPTPVEIPLTNPNNSHSISLRAIEIEQQRGSTTHCPSSIATESPLKPNTLIPVPKKRSSNTKSKLSVCVTGTPLNTTTTTEPRADSLPRT